MTSLGMSRLVVSKLLNHVETGVTRVYDRHSYDGEKKQALELWGRHLDGLGLAAALAAFEGKANWHAESAWWEKRAQRLAGAAPPVGADEVGAK